MKTPTWHLEVRDDLFALQHPEDGSDYTASVFYVTAEASNGRRFAHYQNFYSAEVVHDDDGGGIASYREEALAKAEALLGRIQKAMAAGQWSGPVDNPHWTEIDPVYGSPAYLNAEPELVARERRKDR